MPSLKVKVKSRKGLERKIKNLRKQILKVKDQEVYVGVYADQGIHLTSGLSYTNLMGIHEFGYPENNIPPRPVIRITGNSGKFEAEDLRVIKKSFEGFFSSKASGNVPLKQIGMYYQQKGKDIFGSSVLQETKAGNPPLIMTGDLMDKFSYRTSITYTYKEV